MEDNKLIKEWIVTDELLASNVKSGLLDVFATPSMIALMEYTASELIAPLLGEGITSVGTAVSVKHLAPTPKGAAVTAQAQLIESDGRSFKFKIEVYDEIGLIGEGEHTRVSVKSESFMAKANQRRK